jgi:hypothetical protein
MPGVDEWYFTVKILDMNALTARINIECTRDIDDCHFNWAINIEYMRGVDNWHPSGTYDTPAPPLSCFQTCVLSSSYLNFKVSHWLPSLVADRRPADGGGM